MIIEFEFKKGNREYAGTAYIADGGLYDVTEFYSTNEDGSVSNENWESFKDDIESELSDYIETDVNYSYGVVY